MDGQASQLDQKDKLIADLRIRVDSAEAEATRANQEVAVCQQRERDMMTDIEQLLQDRAEVMHLREQVEQAITGRGGGGGVAPMQNTPPLRVPEVRGHGNTGDGARAREG